MIKKIKFWSKFLNQLIRRYGLILIQGILVGALFFFFLNRLVPLASRIIPQTKRVGVIGRYTLSTLPSQISHLISYGLIEILPNGNATGSAIVSKWTIKSEGREYFFSLKPGVQWQDKTPLKPKQINYQISEAEISAAEEGVKISLESPFAPLISFLSQPIFKNNQIGLGPYEIKKIRLQGGNFSALLLIKVDNPKERILFKFYPNEQSLITGFKLGEIDEAWGISKIDSFSNWENITLKAENAIVQNYVALFFNTRKPPFDSKRIRQGLAYTVKKPIKKDRALSPIAPSSWAYNEKVKSYDFDSDHAKKLLQEEDWPNETTEKIQLQTLPEFLDQAEKIREDWLNSLGLEIEIHVTSFVPDQENFDIFLGYGIIPLDPDQYFFWHSTQQGNLTGINNPKIDQLLEKGRKTVDFQERKGVYFEFQKALSEEIPALFLFYPQNYTLIRN